MMDAKRMGVTALAIGALAMMALPAFAATMAPGEVFALSARPALSLPATVPAGGAAPPAFERAGWAQRQLQDHGLTAVRGLERVGDYWEAEARARGRPVVAYLQDDGTLTFQHYPPAAVAQVFGTGGARG